MARRGKAGEGGARRSIGGAEEAAHHIALGLATQSYPSPSATPAAGCIRPGWEARLRM